MTRPPSLIYTWTDEAPYLATHAFLPVIRGFSGAAGVSVETRDISLSGRVLAVFRDALGAEKTVADDLAELARLVESREANVIKLPNISASIPQLKECIAELRQHGYPLPDYPDVYNDSIKKLNSSTLKIISIASFVPKGKRLAF